MKHCTSQQGFITLSLTLLLPILLAVTLLSFLSAGLINKKQQRNHICQKQVLQLQFRQAEWMQQLLALNPEARSLRKQRKVADKALDIALKSRMPKAIAAAKAYQLYVKSRQLLLRTQQKSLLTRASFDIGLQTQKLKTRLNKVDTNLEVIQTPKQLPVFTKAENTGSPTYHVKPDAEKLHHFEVQWSWNFPPAWNQVLKNVLPNEKTQIHTMTGHCAATLKKRSRKWRNELTPTIQDATSKMAAF